MTENSLYWMVQLRSGVLAYKLCVCSFVLAYNCVFQFSKYNIRVGVFGAVCGFGWLVLGDKQVSTKQRFWCKFRPRDSLYLDGSPHLLLYTVRASSESYSTSKFCQAIVSPSLMAHISAVRTLQWTGQSSHEILCSKNLHHRKLNPPWPKKQDFVWH